MKALKIVATLFLFIGLIFLAVGVITYQGTAAFLKTAVRAEGEVVRLIHGSSSEGSGVYYPLIVYQTEEGREIEFQASVGSNPPRFHEGDRVTILYTPDNPYKARIHSFMQLWFFSVIFGGLGGLFSVLGGSFWTVLMLKKQRKRWLETNGMPVTAAIESIDRDTAIRVNGQSPWRIFAQWQNPENGKIYVFKSEAVWYNPQPYVQQQSITVKINPEKPSHYLMDTSFLPQKG